jgi:hypothetical protein
MLLVLIPPLRLDVATLCYFSRNKVFYFYITRSTKNPVQILKILFHNLPPILGSYTQSSGRRTTTSDKIKTKDFISHDTELQNETCGVNGGHSQFNIYFGFIVVILFKRTLSLRLCKTLFQSRCASSHNRLPNSEAPDSASVWRGPGSATNVDIACNFTYLHLQPSVMQFTSQRSLSC